MNEQHQPRPPQWPLKVLRVFIKQEYLEEIEGDLEELFYDNAEQHGIDKAKQMYAWEVLKIFRPVLLRNLEFLQHVNHAPMFKNYFKVSFRGLMKNPLNTFINVFGLAAAIGFCIFAYAFATWTYSTDQFHKNKHVVFLTTFTAERDGQLQRYGTTPRPLGQLLKQDFAHIRKVCRIEDRNAVMKYKDNVFNERIRFADAEFLEMFSFPLKWGTTSSLQDLNSIVLSEKMSQKYFGEDDPTGNTMQMILPDGRTAIFKVGGVAQEFAKSRSFAFEFLINFENLKSYDPSYSMYDWSAFVSATFIQVDDPVNVKVIVSAMERYKKIQNEAVKPEWAITSFAFEPLATLHERTEEIKDDIAKSSHDNYVSVIFMGVLGGLLLVLACLNYINIAIASAAKRLKEIGVRKSIGATRRIVIVQFLVENIVITSCALLFGLVLGLAFFIPGFELLWKFNMGFKLTDPRVWIFLPLILLVTSIVSGIYPSFYISQFQVVKILKGNVKFGQRNPITKLFLGFQLILCCMFIICSVLFTQNTNYLKERSWGYAEAHAMYAKLPDAAAFDKLAVFATQLPDVESTAGSTHHIGRAHEPVVIHFPSRDFEVDRLAVDAKYFKTLGLEVLRGRLFHDHEGSDQNAVVVNETFVENMRKARLGWDDPIGKNFEIDTLRCEVIGIVKDFHDSNFDKAINPMIFTLAKKDAYRYMTMSVTPGTEFKTYKELQAGWRELYPEIPFDGGLQRDVWGFYYEAQGIYSLVWWVLAFIAVSLATLGLYGLVRLNITGRIKEFSIRKVLGAGLKNISASITKPYAVLFAIAIIIGAPAGFVFSKWLIEFTSVYHKPTSIVDAAIGVLIMITVIVLTIATQIRKVLHADPVQGLKTE